MTSSFTLYSQLQGRITKSEWCQSLAYKPIGSRPCRRLCGCHRRLCVGTVDLQEIAQRAEAALSDRRHRYTFKNTVKVWEIRRKITPFTKWRANVLICLVTLGLLVLFGCFCNRNYSISKSISFAAAALLYSCLCTIIVQMHYRPACITWLLYPVCIF